MEDCKEYHDNFTSNLSQFFEEEVVPHPEDIELSDSSQRWMKGLICNICRKCIALKIENNTWVRISEVLQNEDEDLVGWKEAVNFHERWLQSVLNNVVYYLNEPPDPGQNECDYCLPCKEDKIFLYWSKKELVGFCTMKCKGTLVPGTFMERYSCDIVDSVFIKKSFRRKGLTHELISKLVECYEGDIAFSSPLSNAMKKLLINFLTFQPNKRDHFWLCPEDGDLDMKKNIWMLKKSIEYD